MGRVYNALVKADRLPARERLIGRPASDAAEIKPPRAAAARGDSVSEVAESFPVPEASITREDPVEEFYFNCDGAAPAPAFQSDGGFNPTGASAAPRATLLNARRRVESFPAPHASRPPAPIFEEPRQVANVRGLTIDPHLVALTAQDALAQERYRSLGVRVINAASGRKLKTLVITSAEAGEGKSTVAINLAWVMARRSERRVLLIDASLRPSSISRMLGLAPSRGWLDVADDLSGLAGAMIRLDPNGLYVMAPGLPLTQAEREEPFGGISDALVSSGFGNILAELRQRFDFVVIDAPSVLASADAQHLASVVDGTVIVARSGVTRHSRVTDALALVPEGRRVGIVLNQSEAGESAEPYRACRSLIGRLFVRKK
ncbi:MAG TPA: CpsD/CapB family tyrosine-protein kinase [Blastocatellia bacterium]|jgi:Mrp family chromosome partitioning ATPase